MDNYSTAGLAGRLGGMVKYSLFAIILLVAGNGHCEGVQGGLNLARSYAIEMAIRKNIELRGEALNASMAAVDVVKSRGLYDPVFATSASGGVVSTPGDPFFRTKNGLTSIGLTQYLPTGGNVTAATQSGFTTAELVSPGTTTTDWQSSVGITVTQPLLKNFGKETTELNITLAATTHQDSLERFRFTIADTVLAVVTSYNRVYTLRQVLDARIAALNSTQSLLEEVRQKVKPGAKQTLEIANVEYAMAQRRKEIVEAERNVRDQEAGLRYLIGMEPKVRLIPADPPSRAEPPETEEEALKTALESRTDLKQLHLALKSSQLQERVARHQSLPELALTASGGLTGSAGNFGESYRQIGERPGSFWSAGLQFSVPIGNTAQENEYRKSRIRTEQVRNQIKALSWKIRNDVESDMRALISARLQLHTADRALEYAKQRHEEYLKQSRVGTTPVQDVINAENDLISARNAQLDAVELFAYTVAKLWRDSGALLPRLGITVDTSQPEQVTDGKDPAPPSVAALPAPAPATTMTPEVPGTEIRTLPQTDGSREAAETGSAPAMPAARNAAGNVAAATPAPPGGTKITTAAEVPGTPPATGMYTLMIGEYTSSAAMVKARETVRKAGLSPEVKEETKKNRQIVRVFIAEFSGEESARKELVRLNKVNVDGFFLRSKAGKFRVYAGSYVDQAEAAREHERLTALGVRSSLEKITASVATFHLSAGTFPTREAAQQEATRLEKLGLRPGVEQRVR
jgi:outer membrane protein